MSHSFYFLFQFYIFISMMSLITASRTSQVNQPAINATTQLTPIPEQQLHRLWQMANAASLAYCDHSIGTQISCSALGYDCDASDRVDVLAVFHDDHGHGSRQVGYLAAVDVGESSELELVLAFAGTKTWRGLFLQDTNILQTPFLPLIGGDRATILGKCHRGFFNVYDRVRGSVFNAIESAIRSSPLNTQVASRKIRLTITGHSLGAALSVLTALDLSMIQFLSEKFSVQVVTFGGPRFGDVDLIRNVNARLDQQLIRVTQRFDPVLSVVGRSMGYVHHNGEHFTSDKSSTGNTGNSDTHTDMAQSITGVRCQDWDLWGEDVRCSVNSDERHAFWHQLKSMPIFGRHHQSGTEASDESHRGYLGVRMSIDRCQIHA